MARHKDAVPAIVCTETRTKTITGILTWAQIRAAILQIPGVKSQLVDGASIEVSAETCDDFESVKLHGDGEPVEFTVVCEIEIKE
jgi:hypothetical protein